VYSICLVTRVISLLLHEPVLEPRTIIITMISSEYIEYTCICMELLLEFLQVPVTVLTKYSLFCNFIATGYNIWYHPIITWYSLAQVDLLVIESLSNKGVWHILCSRILLKHLYSQAKWVPLPFSQKLFNHKQIYLCVQVQHCTWAVPYCIS